MPSSQKAVRIAYVHDHGRILGELPHCLRRAVEIRNPAAHGQKTTRDAVVTGRGEVMGIGCEGTIVRLARIRMRSA